METLTTFSVAGLLRAGAAGIRAEIEALPEEVLAWHPQPGEWCVKECLGHIIEAERRGFAGRIRVLLEHDGDATLVSWDQTAVARERNDCDADSAQLLLEFLGLREASVSLVASLRPDDMKRGGEHPVVGHVAMYVGDGRMIESPNSASEVRIVPMRTNDFRGARRFF